jgi:hypothetical protein
MSYGSMLLVVRLLRLCGPAGSVLLDAGLPRLQVAQWNAGDGAGAEMFEKRRPMVRRHNPTAFIEHDRLLGMAAFTPGSEEHTAPTSPPPYTALSPAPAP